MRSVRREQLLQETKLEVCLSRDLVKHRGFRVVVLATYVLLQVE